MGITKGNNIQILVTRFGDKGYFMINTAKAKTKTAKLGYTVLLLLYQIKSIFTLVWA